ncbi:hypothetical protein [Methanocaldococcus sp.]
MIVIPEYAPFYVENYYKVYIGKWTWKYLYSKGPAIPDIFSYRHIFYIISKPFNISLASILMIESIIFQIMAFLGMFFLCRYYLLWYFYNNKKSSSRKIILLISFIVGLFYGICPSFMIGDSFWMGIQFSYIVLPWIILCINKIILDRKLRYIPICALLMIINVDEHFLWAGFPIILALYSGFIFLIKSIKGKKIDFYPILSFFSLMILFVLLILYKIIIRFLSFSSYSYALTRLGLDICWRHATILNMLRAMSHMSLPHIYVPPEHSIFQFLNSLMPLTLIIPVIAFLALLFYRKNWIVLFYSILLIISILPFYVGSPFKWIHYWIFFNTPIGPAFRTWRIPDAYIALSLSILMAFSLYHIFEKLYKSRKQVLIGCLTIGILFIFCIYSWPLLTGDVNGYLSPVKVPKEYNSAHNYFTNISGIYRIISIPDFSHSYGPNSNFKPFWSPKLGMIPSFLFYSSPKPTIPDGWSGVSWNPYYKFTLSYYYWSLLRKGDVNALSHFLGWVNIKYIVIHNDIPNITKRVENSIKLLNCSENFNLVFHDGFMYIFENNLTKGEIYTPPQLILVDGGYRAVNKFYDSINDSNTYGFIFIDQGISPKLINNIKIILTDKSKSQLIKDLVCNIIFEQYPKFIIYPYKYVVDFDPKNKWSRASLLDAENQVWHPFVNWKNYAWDFDYMKGIVFTINSKDKFTIPIKIEKKNSYVLLIRYLVSEKGGLLKVDVNGQQFKIDTLGNYNGFLWKVIKLGTLQKGVYKLTVQNVNGFNAVNLFVLIPEKDYVKSQKEAEKLLQNKTVIYIFEAESDLYKSNSKIIKSPEASNGELIILKNGKVWQYVNIVKNGTYRIALKGIGKFKVKIGNYSFIINSNNLNFTYTPTFYLNKGKYKLEVTTIKINVKNLVKNPSFEDGAKFWYWKTKKFIIKLDNTTSYTGKYSLRVSTSIDKKWTWSWIRSEPINVEPGKRYLIITHMKIQNANASHIPIEGYFVNKKQWKQLVQIPSGKYGTGTYNWKEFKDIIKIPKNVTKIRVVLNAGWVLNKRKGKAITWFDDIQVIPLNEPPKLDVIWLYSAKNNETIKQLFQVKEKPAKIISYKKINPTLWEVQVNATKPFMLSFAESYDPLWEARVYKDGKLVEKVSPVPLYGVINGFYINETGNLKIVIRYKPQDWFDIGLAISGITFICCISYLIYDWRREKGDKWAINLNKKLNNIISKIKIRK